MTLAIYFLRHGQTSHSRDNNFCGAGTNIKLTPEGEEMGREFALAYKSKKFRAIYVSPLKRTVDMAKEICAIHKMRMIPRNDLKEIHYGKWEGRNPDYVNSKYHDDYIKWQADPAWNAPTGGEPAIRIAKRAMNVVEEIKSKYKDGNVLIVSHKATIRIMLCGFLGIDVGRFRYRLSCPVGSISKVEFTKSGPLIKLLGDQSHLSEYLRNLPGT